MHILITGARAPVAMHFARHMSAAGHRAWIADTFHFPISRATRTKQAYLRLPPPRRDITAYGEAIRAVVARYKIDLIIPTCEEVFYLAALRDVFGFDLPLLAPDFAKLKAAHDKFEFTGLAQGLGADAPETHLIQTPNDLTAAQNRSGDWVYKPVWSRFGERVLIKPTAQALSELKPTIADPWLQQAYLLGEELCGYAIAHQGRLTALQAYRPTWRAGQGIGAGVFVELVKDRAIEAFVAGFIAKYDWHGQISFDFRRDEAGTLHVLECNPRATTGALFFGPGDELAAAMLSGTSATAHRSEPLSIGMAMMMFGLPEAVRTRRLSEWWRDYRCFKPMLGWPGDRSGMAMQWLSLCEATYLAATIGQSLKAATTSDIEWNGGDFR